MKNSRKIPKYNFGVVSRLFVTREPLAIHVGAIMLTPTS